MTPEYKYNLLGKAKFLHYLLSSRSRDFQDLRKECLKSLALATEDCQEFLRISPEEFWDYADSWPKIESELFAESISIHDFYQKWQGDNAGKNICANIINQMLDPQLYSICAYFANKANSVLDYGCGTGTLSLSLLLNKRISGDLLLLDVPNDINNFIEFRCKRRNLTNVSIGNVLDKSRSIPSVDLLICLDVLEHLDNSTQVFCEGIYPLLQKNGILIMRAPWRGQLTHLDEAADNFYLHGGKRFLARNFRELYRFGSMDVACVYRKIS